MDDIPYNNVANKTTWTDLSVHDDVCSRNATDNSHCRRPVYDVCMCKGIG